MSHYRGKSKGRGGRRGINVTGNGNDKYNSKQDQHKMKKKSEAVR